ncbi:MAG: hypothetical protein HY287_13930 [Planctomycetes bacterium]|nr:hypothetical protein [Planctomycetota bacterium]MBI3835421.1 hypothetical protein [Planctomycetota bacterium]
MKINLQRSALLFAVVSAIASHRGGGQTINLANLPEDLPIVVIHLLTGGELRGVLVDSNNHAVVILREKTPFVFAWKEMTAECAIEIHRTMLAKNVGGVENFSAREYYDLGQFALSIGRNDLASKEFHEATRRSRGFEKDVRRAYDEFRKQSKTRSHEAPLGGANGHEDELPAREETVADASGDSEPPYPNPIDWSVLNDGSTPQRREQVMEKYRVFGEKVREVIGLDVALVESEHFLIWTDWPAGDRVRLSTMCEQMYSAVNKELHVPEGEQVFLAKCPVFCWRNRARFLKFARNFDGYDAADAVGYSRSIANTGHVHLVLVRPGNSTADADRFACTLVHEGTHAFMHRLFSTRLIPGWVNEGFAEMMVERVLGDRSETTEKATLLAREYARFDWPIGNLIDRGGPIEVSEYALAQSLVEYLESRDHSRFVEFIKCLKQGSKASEALAVSFDGMTVSQLESAWKSANGRN